MRFRLVGLPKSSTLDDLERPERTLLQKRCGFWSLLKIDPYYQRQKCKPMTLVSGNISACGYSQGFLLAGASNESPTAIFGDLSGYFFGNFRDKASNII